MNKVRLNRIISLFCIILSCLSLCFSIVTIISFHYKKNVNEILGSVCQIKAVSEVGVNSYGTGFVIERNRIVTNYHVVNFEDEELNEVLIRFPNEETYSLAIIETIDEFNDIAFLYFKNENNIKSIYLLDVLPDYGDECFAISNTNNYGISVLKGTITIPLIKIESSEYNDYFIQANIDIYPGSSGGCLLNSNYQCIGILTFRLKDSTNSPIYGFGYAIPSNRILTILSD